MIKSIGINSLAKRCGFQYPDAAEHCGPVKGTIHMRAIIQRVHCAEIIIDGKETRKIGPGLVVFLGVMKGDALIWPPLPQRRSSSISALWSRQGRWASNRYRPASSAPIWTSWSITTVLSTWSSTRKRSENNRLPVSGRNGEFV